MKNTVAVVLLIIAASGSALAQACKPVDIAPDAQRKQLLRQYMEECRRGHYFIEDKGIINIVAYQDGKGRQVWSMWAMIDDRYQDNPPNTYTKFEDIVVLVYQADSAGRRAATPKKDIDALSKCLEEVVENRVYPRPTQKDRFVEAPGPDGSIKKYPVRTIVGGGYWNSKKIIFNKDGTYQIFAGV